MTTSVWVKVYHLAYGGITGVVSGAILSILGKIGFDKLKVRKKQKTSSLPNSQN